MATGGTTRGSHESRLERSGSRVRTRRGEKKACFIRTWRGGCCLWMLFVFIPSAF
uniref:Uncharacterized protein n=1 Tax=Arundo donax TaxID=35708 RepID=A0A0A9ADP1_ARUDO